MSILNTPYTPQLPKNTSQQTLALYIHWPWCLKKCPYCDFNAHVSSTYEELDYFNIIIKELELLSKIVNKSSLTSIFFGGGTPSLASPRSLEQVIHAAKTLFPKTDDHLEVTLEVNPATFKHGMFHDFVSAGITRFSIGVQSLVPEELKFLGRAHNNKEALLTIEQAQESQAQVSTDFIYGLPQQNLTLWEQNLRQIAKMGTDHLSAYQLTIEPGTAFFGEVRKSKWSPLNSDEQADFFETTQQVLKENQFYNYEISNFAKTDSQNILKVCKHNLHVWRYGDYLGVGAGAHGRFSLNKNFLFSKNSENKTKINNQLLSIEDYSDLENSFSQIFKNLEFSNLAPSHSNEVLVSPSKVSTRNFKMPETYMKGVLEKSHAIYQSEIMTEESMAEEIALNGLRLSEGLDLKTHAFVQSYLNNEKIDFLIKNNLLLWDKNEHQSFLKTTAKGAILLDSLLPEIFL